MFSEQVLLNQLSMFTALYNFTKVTRNVEYGVQHDMIPLVSR